MRVPLFVALAVMAGTAAAVPPEPCPGLVGVSPTRPSFGMSVAPRGGVIVVGAIDPGGPADLAGIVVGDTVVAIDGDPAAFASRREMLEYFDRFRASEPVVFSIVGDSGPLEVAVSGRATTCAEALRLAELIQQLSKEAPAPACDSRGFAGQGVLAAGQSTVTRNAYVDFLNLFLPAGGSLTVSMPAGESPAGVTLIGRRTGEAGDFELAPDGLPEILRNMVAALRPGDEIELRVNPGSGGLTPGRSETSPSISFIRLPEYLVPEGAE